MMLEVLKRFICSDAGFGWMFIAALLPQSIYSWSFFAILWIVFAFNKTLGKKPFSKEKPTWKWALLNAYIAYYVCIIVMMTCLRLVFCKVDAYYSQPDPYSQPGQYLQQPYPYPQPDQYPQQPYPYAQPYPGF